MRLRGLGIVLVLSATLIRCGGSDDASETGGGTGAGAGVGGLAAGGGGFGASGGGASLDAGADAPPPPEKELESSYRAPVATGKYVWTANPDSGRVALVDATTLEVKIAEAGFAPT